MTNRRTLVEGLKSPEDATQSKKERDFVYRDKPPEEPPESTRSVHHARSPLSTRIRSDFATALKRASLERQLAGVEPSSLQSILEQAIEPWLKSNGYLN